MVLATFRFDLIPLDIQLECELITFYSFHNSFYLFIKSDFAVEEAPHLRLK